MSTATERATEAIRTKILTGELEPGARLREEDLAEAIGVSRTPVREALRRLDADGLVEFNANRGAQVASWSEHDIEEIFGLRAVLEGYGARLAATRITPEELAAARQDCAQMDQAASRTDLDAVAALNQRFHQRVLAASGNSRLVDSLAKLVELPLVHRTFRRYDVEALARSLAHHHELLAALEARDATWAESVMRSHVLAARAALARSNSVAQAVEGSA